MLVHGTSRFNATLADLLTRLSDRLQSANDHATRNTADVIRGLLLQTGQIEQAVLDYPDAPAPLLEPLAALTARFASALLVCWQGGEAAALQAIEQAGDDLKALCALPEVAALDALLTIEIPEGFGFHALYPEQFIVAAEQWATDRARAEQKEGDASEGNISREVVIAAIRPAGTTLVAVVAAALQAHGWSPRQLTVRPQRRTPDTTVTFPPLSPGSWVLVVDGGEPLFPPASVLIASALVEAGALPGRIAFLTAPGERSLRPAAYAEWSDNLCYAPALDTLRWEGSGAIGDILTAAAARFLHTDAEGAVVEAIQQGLLPAGPADKWPASYLALARPRYRITLADGQAVLWQFEGQTLTGAGGDESATVALRTLANRASHGWSAVPLGAVMGWVALPWAVAEPLTTGDADPRLLTGIGRYIAASSASVPPLTDEDKHHGVAALRALLYWNVWEGLGSEVAARTLPWATLAARWVTDEVPFAASGDGLMAPPHWVRTASGNLFKVGNTGRDRDNTGVGPQPVAWDIAGAIAEWGLTGDDEIRLLAAFEAGGGVLTPTDVLVFYQMAYAALRLGQAMHCLESFPHDRDEQGRLCRAADGYRETICALLDRPFEDIGLEE